LEPRSGRGDTVAVAPCYGLGFKGMGGVGGARQCDGQLLTALCRGLLDVRELMSES